jgi:hypothetical protein
VRPNLTIHVFFLKRHERKCKWSRMYANSYLE